MEKNPVQAQKFLKGIDYPASKQDIVQKAKSEGADDRIVQALERLPDRRFEGPQAVSQAIGDIS